MYISCVSHVINSVCAGKLSYAGDFWCNFWKFFKNVTQIKTNWFRRFSNKFQSYLRETLYTFLRKFVRFLKSTCRSSWAILVKFWENWRKILNYSRKFMEILLGKIEVIRDRCFWYYEEILESLSEIISVKLGKKPRRNLRKTLKNVENTLYKLLKKY